MSDRCKGSWNDILVIMFILIIVIMAVDFDILSDKLDRNCEAIPECTIEE